MLIAWSATALAIRRSPSSRPLIATNFERTLGGWTTLGGWIRFPRSRF